MLMRVSNHEKCVETSNAGSAAVEEPVGEEARDWSSFTVQSLQRGE
jgi:hypothetical protein